MAMVTNTDQVYSYHFNAIGSTVAMTDSPQNIVNKYSYDVFGNIENQQENIPQPFKFVGQFGVMTEPNGFYYMRARYYDPQVGRFISEDPIGFEGGINQYIYASQNPILLIDPEGLSDRSVALGATSAALNTASLATIWNPVLSAKLKIAGTIMSGVSIINAGYEYYTEQMSKGEATATVTKEVSNILFNLIPASKISSTVEAAWIGFNRVLDVGTTTYDIGKTAASKRGRCK